MPAWKARPMSARSSCKSLAEPRRRHRRVRPAFAPLRGGTVQARELAGSGFSIRRSGRHGEQKQQPGRRAHHDAAQNVQNLVHERPGPRHGGFDRGKVFMSSHRSYTYANAPRTRHDVRVRPQNGDPTAIYGSFFTFGKHVVRSCSGPARRAGHDKEPDTILPGDPPSGRSSRISHGPGLPRGSARVGSRGAGDRSGTCRR